MTFAIAGVTGNTGKIVAETLLAGGQKVRAIVRTEEKGRAWAARGAEVAVADLTDVPALTRALADVRGAYVLSPPNDRAPVYRAYQDEVSRALAAAVAESRVPHVVLLSSVGAQHASGTGPIAGLHVTESLLRAEAVTILRAAYFYDNLGGAIAAAKAGGPLPSFLPADFAIDMVSTRDIGELAAELLRDAPPPGSRRIVELGTPRTVREIAAALGPILGRTVDIQEAPLDAVVPTFTSYGFTEDLARSYAEMIGAFLSGRVVFEGTHRRAPSREPLERVLRALAG